ncbi:hypothetical protein APT_00002 [Acetobacter pasteurianus NBRC 101655]|uniref:Spy/CpxP family protein refolding chaperone n=1 Tax=Acetobacter pasteurianus TaxID=438 RepID=UPI00024574BD|nr:Spy/CpxP family protein refolding chaperone [Acetobacter pasteurianus]BAU37084.1 hypothetical protein APT_00002 [Acetobacter pasteurianus NBRC 101655]CCT59568.1 hypothetical protein APA386B_1486 [Acetobacter pasteurianus 386B]
MKKVLMATALTLGMMTSAVSFAHAQEATPAVGGPPPGGPGCGPMHHHGMGGPILKLDGVKLTSAQKKKLKAIFDANKPSDPKADMEQIHSLHQQEREVLTTPGPVDQAKLQQIEQQISTMQTERATQRLQVETQVHDILTKKQLRQIADRPEPQMPPMCGNGAPPAPPPAATESK